MSAAPAHSHFVGMTMRHRGYLCLSSWRRGSVSFVAKGGLNPQQPSRGLISASGNTDSVSGARSHFNYNRRRGGSAFCCGRQPQWGAQRLQSN